METLPFANDTVSQTIKAQTTRYLRDVDALIDRYEVQQLAADSPAGESLGALLARWFRVSRLDEYF